MKSVAAIPQAELIERIRASLSSRPYKSSYSHFRSTLPPTPPAAYALILGAGFSHPVVPLVAELMHETIGDYHFPDQDQFGKRPSAVLRKDSARFWAELNDTAAARRFPLVELDGKGLPVNPGAAYQYLFTGAGADALFTAEPQQPKRASFVQQLTKRRRERMVPSEARDETAPAGRRFVDGFLRYVLDPGGEHGYGSTGRNELNPAHVYLAALLEAQQLGQEWKTAAFCRTIFTTNFDTLLQNALQMVNLLYRITDRPENGFDRSDFDGEEGPIHLAYVHGSILRHNPASTTAELSELERTNIKVLRDYLDSRDVIVIGYSGWNDGLMAALRKCESTERHVYWCDVRSEPAPHVEDFLAERRSQAAYVQLCNTGADDFMRDLYGALVPTGSGPGPMQRYREWQDLVWNRKARATS